uniref:N-acetyltransferase domain-containing protein n=1 Tax=Phaselicystis flava TaxID=525924 RepID=A0A3S5GYG6_9BACT|nr:hypothetical protein [Phaselicystis flava]
MPIEITRATGDEATLLRNLYPLYLHDLTEFSDFYSIDDRGVWQPDYLDFWLSGRPDTHPLILRAEGRPIGFACVGQAPFPFMSPERDFHLSEFFVLRKHRRRGLGRAAARALFDRFPGTWELSEVPENAAAIAFWRRIIGEYTGGAFDEVIVDGCPMQIFSTARR